MALTARAVAILRQLHDALNTDLADIDLEQLRKVTAGTKQDRDTQQWVRLLEVCAPLLGRFSKELSYIQRYIKGRFALSVTFLVLVIILFVVILVLTVQSFRENWSDLSSTPEAITATGMTLTTILVLMGVLTGFIVALGKSTELYTEDSGRMKGWSLRNARALRDMIRIDKLLGSRFIVRYANFVAGGMAKEMNDTDGGFTETGVDCPLPGAVEGGDKELTCEMKIVCSPEDLVPLAEAVWSAAPAGCSGVRNDDATRGILLDGLMEIKADVDRFDPVSLWRCVARGIEEARHMCYTKFDDGRFESAGDAVKSAADAKRVIMQEVLPLLRVPALQPEGLSLHKASLDAALKDAPDDLRKRASAARSATACWRACIEAGEDSCTWAHFQENEGGGVCTLGAALDRLAPSNSADAAPGAVVVRATPDVAFVCGDMPEGSEAARRARALAPGSSANKVSLDACRTDAACRAHAGGVPHSLPSDETYASFFGTSGGEGARKRPALAKHGKRGKGEAPEGSTNFCVRTTCEELHRSGLPALPEVLRQQSAAIAEAIADVLARHRYRVELEPYVGVLRQEMAVWAQADKPQGPPRADLDAALDEVLRVARQRVAAAKKRTLASPYMDVRRFQTRLSATPRDKLDLFTDRMVRAAHCAMAHRTNFPFSETPPDGVTPQVYVMLSYGFTIGLVLLALFMLSTRLRVEQNQLTTEEGVRTALVVGCSTMVLFTVVAVLTAKRARRVHHNRDMTETNGHELVAGVSTLARIARGGSADCALPLPAWRKARVEGTRSDALGDCKRSGELAKDTGLQRRLFAAMQRAIEAYDQCNTLTSSIARPPFPVAEGITAATIVVSFAVMGGIVLNSMEPARKLQNIRTLLGLRERVKRGELMSQLMTQIECCTPSLVVWDKLKWLGVMALVVGSLYFVVASQDSSIMYERSLRLQPGCVS